MARSLFKDDTAICQQVVLAKGTCAVWQSTCEENFHSCLLSFLHSIEVFKKL